MERFQNKRGGFLQLIFIIIVALFILRYLHLTISDLLGYFNLTVADLEHFGKSFLSWLRESWSIVGK